MALEVKHTTQAVGTDAGNGEIRKAQWNEAHTINMASGKLLGRSTAGDGVAEEIAIGSGLSLSSGTLAATGGSGPLTIDNKTAAYTVVAGDLGKIINCTSGTFTVSLTAAATLGAGFNCWIWNTSNGTAADAITIDPNASETIDGRSTLELRRGEGVQIVCNGANWQTGDKKTMRGYSENIDSSRNRPVASGANSIAIGISTTASGSGSLAIGYGTSSGSGATSIGAYFLNTNVLASANYSTAIGGNSAANPSQAVTGAGAMALGGSYASGTDSFAAAIADNTSSYGATGTWSVALGPYAKSTNTAGVALGLYATASGIRSFAVSYGATASGTGAIAIGAQQTTPTTASASYSVALGAGAVANITGKFAYASGFFSGGALVQTGILILRRNTTDATPTVLATDNSAPGTTNQVILPNNSTYTFRVQVVGMQQAAGGTNTAGYTFEGVIRRGANAAATVLKNSVKTVLQEDDASWDCNVSADTTNGGLAVTVTGAAATNIRWVATVTTSEVTYA